MSSHNSKMTLSSTYFFLSIFRSRSIFSFFSLYDSFPYFLFLLLSLKKIFFSMFMHLWLFYYYINTECICVRCYAFLYWIRAWKKEKKNLLTTTKNRMSMSTQDKIRTKFVYKKKINRKSKIKRWTNTRKKNEQKTTTVSNLNWYPIRKTCSTSE